jgi:hypothetical protein
VTAAMPSSKVMRVFLGLMLLLSLANMVRVLQQPQALRFFAVAIVVAATVGAVGSVVALIIVAVRRLSSR